MGDVIVTDTNTPAAGNDQILIVRPFNGTPTPTSRLKPDTYYSFKNTWYKLFQPIYDLLKAYVPITRTITINGDTQDLSTNRSWTVTAANYIDSVANTDTINLNVTDAELTANVKYQDSADINISADASGIKAEFVSHDVSQFTNDADYFVNGSALDNGTTATTQASGDNTTKVATTAFVHDRDIYLNRNNKWEWFLDFEANPSGNFSSEESNFAVTSTGAFTLFASTSNNVGIVSMDTGAGSAGGAVAGTGVNTIQFGNGVTYTESLIQIPTLSTNTQRFKTFTGFFDILTSVADGAYVTQIDNENSGNWVFSCSSGGTTTSFNLSSAPTAGTWYKIGILINAAGTEARCYINGVEPSGIGYPITSNIPTGATNQTGVRTGILKSVGTTSRSLLVDYLYGRIIFTTAR